MKKCGAEKTSGKFEIPLQFLAPDEEEQSFKRLKSKFGLGKALSDEISAKYESILKRLVHLTKPRVMTGHGEQEIRFFNHSNAFHDYFQGHFDIVKRVSNASNFDSQTCTWKNLELLKPPGPSVVLASKPGSGNTWTRYLLQMATGVQTGSFYNDTTLKKSGYPGEGINNGSVLAIKHHRISLYVLI